MSTGHLFGLIQIFQLLVLALARNLPEIIDLSYPYDNSTYYWPVPSKVEGFEKETIFKGQNEKYGVWYQSYKFCSREHGGTHIDAPAHYYEPGWTVDQIPVERLIAPAIVVDIREKASKSPDVKLEVSDLEKWEEENGEIPPKSIVLMLSGWGQYWGNLTAFVGNADDDPENFHFPGIDVEAGRWLLKRDIVGVGVDTPSIDAGFDRFKTHVLLAKESKFNLENVANLERLTPKGYTLIASPIKVTNGSGGPTRILAIKGNSLA